MSIIIYQEAINAFIPLFRIKAAVSIAGDWYAARL